MKRVNADDSAVRFKELDELCTVTGDKTSLAIGMQAAVTDHHVRGEMREASRLASEQAALLDSIGDPYLIVLAFGAIGVKAGTGELADVMRWSEATIDWAKGDPAKGNLVVGSPLAMAMMMRATARYWFGQPGWREDFDGALANAEEADSLSLALVVAWRCIGIMHGVLPADDAAVEMVETALRTAEASGENYAVAIAMTNVGFLLLLRGEATDRDRALTMVAQIREMSMRRQYPASELPH